MEMKKVLRIVGTFIAVAAFGILVAHRLMFPDASLMQSLPIFVCFVVATIALWIPDTKKQNTK